MFFDRSEFGVGQCPQGVPFEVVIGGMIHDFDGTLFLGAIGEVLVQPPPRGHSGWHGTGFSLG